MKDEFKSRIMKEQQNYEKDFHDDLNKDANISFTCIAYQYYNVAKVFPQS